MSPKSLYHIDPGIVLAKKNAKLKNDLKLMFTKMKEELTMVGPQTPADPLSTAKERLQWEGVALKLANKLVGYVKNKTAVHFIADRMMKHLDVPSTIDVSPPPTACEKIAGWWPTTSCLLVKGHGGCHFDPNQFRAWADGGPVWDGQKPTFGISKGATNPPHQLDEEEDVPF